MMKLRSTIALLLILCMLIGILPALVFAAEESIAQSSLNATEIPGLSRLESINYNGNPAEDYADDESVTVIIVMEDPAILDHFQQPDADNGQTTGEAIAEFLASEDAAAMTEHLLQAQNAVIQLIMSSNYPGETPRILSQWTGIANGMAVRVPFGLLQTIRQMPGVKGAYVSNTFSAPQSEVEEAGTAGYSYSMVGVGAAWEKGYTGSGMLIAILDTGLDLEYGSWYDEEVGDNVTGVRSAHEAFSDTSFRTEEAMNHLRWTNESLAAFLEETQLIATTGADGSKVTYDNNALYKNRKVPYAADYCDGDVNVRPSGNNHGTHVAGTVAGYAEAEDGTVIFSGVAPDAQILAMKVFDDYGSGAPEYAILSALEDAAVLGADVMNLSYGATSGFAFEDTLVYEVYQRLNASGILFMTAAGNDGPSSAYNNRGDLNLSSDPDVSMMGSPAAFSSNLAVGSVDNLVATMPRLQWFDTDGTMHKATYVDPFEVAIKNTLGTGVYNVISVPGYGSVEDYRAAGFNDSYYGYGDKGEIGIALVKRGGTNEDGSAMTFADKIYNAARFAYTNWEYNPISGEYEPVTEQFIKAVIIYDSDPESEELIFMSIADAILTAAFICGKDGNAMAAAAEAAQENGLYVTLTVPEFDELVDNPTAGEVSSFSSWGASPSLNLKPEIIAPGGYIWSTIMDDNYVVRPGRHDDYTGSYGMLSGTSMATPHMSGITALVMQYLMAAHGMSSDEAAIIADNLMVSTATPLVDENGVYYSPRAQGAGLVNVNAVLETPAYIHVEGHNVGKIELMDDPEKKGEYVLSFQVVNMSDAALTYDVTLTVLVPGTEEGKDGLLFMQTSDVTLMELSVGTVTVEAGSTATFTTTLTLSDQQKATLDSQFPNGTYIEGFISLTNEAVPQIGLPFMGFYGDWTAAPIFDQHTWMSETEEGQYFWELDSTWGVSILGYFDGYSFRNLGQNPFDPVSGTEQWEYHEENITIAPYGIFLGVNDIELYQMRNAKMIVVEVRDAETGELYYRDFATYQYKTYYDYNTGAPVPWSLRSFTETAWDGTDLNGDVLPSGTDCVYTITAYADGEYPMIQDETTGQEFTNFQAVAEGNATPTFNGHEMDMTGDVLSYNMLVDTVAPKLVNNTVSFYEEDGRVYVTGTFQDDGSIASIEIVPHVKRTNNYNPDYYEYGMDDINPFFSELIYDARLGEYTFVADVTEYAHKNLSYEGEDNIYSYEWTGNVYIFCGDYGGNDRAYIINIDTSDGLILTNTSALLYTGGSFELNVIDNTGSGTDLTRTSSNPEVATIDEFGLVKAIAPGQTTITISNGTDEAVCIVAVTERPTEVIDFDLSIDHFSGLKPDGSIVVNVVNIEPADVIITENTWLVYEDNEEWAGLLNVSKDAETGLSGRINLNYTYYGEEGSSAGAGRLEVTINGVTRTMTLDWEELYATTEQDGLISNAYYGEQTIYIQQGQAAELIAQYRLNTNHSIIPVELYTMVGYESYGNNNPTIAAEGLVLDGPDFTANGSEWRGKLVALPGYELPAEIKVCTRYSYGYESEMYLNSYYAGYSYDPETGEIVVQQAPYGADNVLVIRADGVATEGAPGGTLSSIDYVRPDGLYGPFEWTLTEGNGELSVGTKQDYYAGNVDYASFVPSQPGVSYITATSKDGQYSIHFAVICTGIQAETLDLESHNLELDSGETFQLDVSMNPFPTLAQDQALVFTSFNEDVATVDENGLITAHKAGYAYIRVTCATNCKVMTYCIVQVHSCQGDHNFGEYEVITPATCEEAGVEKRVCQVCDFEETRAIPAIGHSFSEWVVAEEATETTDGRQERTCETCGHTESEVIPMTGVNPPTGDFQIGKLLMTMAFILPTAILLLKEKEDQE